MNPLLDQLENLPLREVPSGETVLCEGDCTGLLLILVEGEVVVTKDGVEVTRCADPGAFFGDLSALLGLPHTAEVRAAASSRFRVIENPVEYLEAHPRVMLQLCRLLARRLDAVNRYLVDLKHQFTGHDHLGMVDGMLDLLMHRQPRERVRPRISGDRDAEFAG